MRRVIEAATPSLARGLRPEPKMIVLAGGELPDAQWLQNFEKLLHPLPVQCRADKALLYLSEQRGATEKLTLRIRSFLGNLLTDGSSPCLVWAHNQGLGRNLLLTDVLQQECGSRQIRLVMHHHDWWFDNRWERWPEMRRHGFRTLAKVASVVLASSPEVRHVAINRADYAVLQNYFGKRAAWVPNPAPSRSSARGKNMRRTRAWLAKELSEAGPVWLLPCRLLRRKNIAEALLLTRWLRPEAWLVTTGGPSSPEEEPYANRLRESAVQHGWQLRLGALHYCDSPKPSVFDLMQVSEAVVLTSLQEGFGLPYLEAPAARRPLIARALPNIMPDLAGFGFRFPHVYQELLVAPSLFNWHAEAQRQRRVYAQWLRRLPESCQRFAARPALLKVGEAPVPIPFSRLTLTAQLEVLQAPLQESWELCAGLNPFLVEWRKLAARRALKVTAWPKHLNRWLSGAAYLRGFQRVIASRGLKPPIAGASRAAQKVFIARTLATRNLFPLAWNSNT